MKPSLLLGSVFALLLGLALLAQSIRYDPSQANRVPHPAGTMLAVTFAHADHVEQTCISCHHNYVDATGIGMCLDCHKTDATVSPLIEQQFHDLCMGCHEQEQGQRAESGPVRRCVSCHTADQDP